MFKVVVLISGSGSNMESIINASMEKESYKVVAVISDRPANGIERAKRLGVVNTYELDRKKEDYNKELFHIISKENPDFIVLAGYLSIIGEDLLNEYEGRIINIHPSLLPLHGGMGMYGIKVHESVIKAKEKESGCTCHIVSNKVDMGRILVQKKVDVYPEDKAEDLQKRVLKYEHEAIVEGLLKVIEEKGGK